MSDELERFLREGVTKYPEACDTVRYFREQLEQHVIGIVQRRSRWTAFRPNAGPDAYWQERTEAGTYWLYEGVTGTTPKGEEASLHLGIWWRSPTKDDVILAIHFRKPKAYLRFAHTNQDRIKKFTYDRLDRLYLRPEPDLDAAFNALLDDLEAAVLR